MNPEHIRYNYIVGVMLVVVIFLFGGCSSSDYDGSASTASDDVGVSTNAPRGSTNEYGKGGGRPGRTP